MLDIIIEIYEDETFLKADGYDDAIIGVEEHSMRLIYSVKKCIEIIMFDPINKTLQMTEEEALEFFNYNVSGAYLGSKTPIWCYDYFN